MIDEIRAKMAALKEELKAAVSKTFTELSAKLFTDNPAIKSFGWTQYTDYFNYGDACYFHAHTDNCSVNGVNRYDDDEDEDGNKVDEKLYDVVDKFLSQFTNEDFESMFGDHAEITVTPDKVDVSSYTHHD